MAEQQVAMQAKTQCSNSATATFQPRRISSRHSHYPSILERGSCAEDLSFECVIVYAGFDKYQRLVVGHLDEFDYWGAIGTNALHFL
jgi:hypothetical protein